MKRTLFFGNPYYLKTRDEQLVVVSDKKEVATIPIQDIGYVVLEHPRIAYSQALLQRLLSNNVAVLVCDERRHPAGMFLPLDSHYLQQERFRLQINAALPLKKRLWAATIKTKLGNQSKLLEWHGLDYAPIRRWAGEVKSGDSTNMEAQGAKFYWRQLSALFHSDFTRGRHGIPPNNMLNYGYAILRAAMARALSGSGLLPTLGIHHHNRYNAFCLADDIMEPYRPFVDDMVIAYVEEMGLQDDLDTPFKRHILGMLQNDVRIGGMTRPLMGALSHTAASLVSSYASGKPEIIYGTIAD